MQENEGRIVRVAPSVVNRDIIETYTVAAFHDSVGLYGQRLMLRLVEAAYSVGVTENRRFSRDGCCPVCLANVRSDLVGHVTIEMPVTAVMGDAREYSKVKKDIMLCMSEIISYRDSDGSDVMFPFLTYAKCGRGKIRLEVREELWNAILDYSRGFRRFELQAALRLKSKYSLRLYQLMSGQTESLTYSIQEIKRILGCIWVEEEGVGKKKVFVEKELYVGKPMDFVKRVIVPSKLELDTCSPYTFDFTLDMCRRSVKGRKAVKAITFFPKKQEQFRDADLEANALVGRNSGAFGNFGLGREERDILMNFFELTEKGIRNNHFLWEAIKEEERRGTFNLLKTLDVLKARASNTRPDNLPKFVIGSLRAIMRGMGVQVRRQ